MFFTLLLSLIGAFYNDVNAHKNCHISYCDVNLLSLLYMFFWVFPRCQIVVGQYPKEHIQYSNHGESFKSRLLALL